MTERIPITSGVLYIAPVGTPIPADLNALQPRRRWWHRLVPRRYRPGGWVPIGYTEEGSLRAL